MINGSKQHANEDDTTRGGSISRVGEATGLRCEEGGSRLDMRANTEEAWEADRCEPRANKLVALAGILNVSPPYLLSGFGKQPPQSALPERQITQLKAQVEQLEQSLKTATTSLRQIKKMVIKMK